MEQFLAFFEGMPPSQKLIWIMICMTLNFIIEGIRPLFAGGFRSWRHTRTNLALLGTTMFISIISWKKSMFCTRWTTLPTLHPPGRPPPPRFHTYIPSMPALSMNPRSHCEPRPL